MKFSIKKDRTFVLSIQNKETLEKEVITVRGDYSMELFFSNDFPKEGISRIKMDDKSVMQSAAREITELTEERDELKQEVKRLRKSVFRR